MALADGEYARYRAQEPEELNSAERDYLDYLCAGARQGLEAGRRWAEGTALARAFVSVVTVHEMGRGLTDSAQGPGPC
jgi:hypothetical protein